MFRPIAKLVATLFLYSSVAAGQAYSPVNLESVVSNVASLYATHENVGLNEINSRFFGFEYENLKVVDRVAIFHADSPFDISRREYECGAAGCEIKFAFPRCFYHAETGGYSISNFMTALESGIDSLFQENVGDDSILAAKFWQSGTNIYGKISFEKTNQSLNKLFLCQHSLVFRCEETVDFPPNEP